MVAGAGRLRATGLAVAVRADRPAETVNAGAEYKLTPLSAEEYDLYQAAKDGLATEVTDELIGRNKNQPIEEALQAGDEEALAAFRRLAELEGIIPALESSHAIAYACKLAATLPKDKTILVNLSGRGDKDMHTVAQESGLKF